MNDYLERDKNAIANWKPRNIEVGKDLLILGDPTVYEDNSPEKKLAEFLYYWKATNYGYMANCIATQLGHPTKELPRQVREEYFGKRLKFCEFRKIKDESPAVTVISVYVEYEENGLTTKRLVEARLICEDNHNFGVMRGKPGSRWALVTWYLKAVDG